MLKSTSAKTLMHGEASTWGGRPFKNPTKAGRAGPRLGNHVKFAGRTAFSPAHNLPGTSPLFFAI